MNLSKCGIFVLSISLLFILSCSNGNQIKEQEGDNMIKNKSYQNSLDSIPEQKWEKLSRKKIYFGHQSVGANIIDGIKDIIQKDSKLKLRIKETSDKNDFSAPIFAHSRIGRNRDGQSKINDFQNKVKSDLGNNVDIAVFKFCYVDIWKDTDVQKLFDSYKKTMQKLQEEFPKTVFIYTTIPLKTVKTSWKTWIKKLIGQDFIWEYADNIKRNEFNTMIRQEYEDTGKLFDIAFAESNFPDGFQEEFKKNGKKFAALSPLLTDDGGHLNELGRKVVAASLLKTLTDVGN